MNRFDKRPLSHSQLSSFEYSPEQWYQSYILGIRQPANTAMLMGNKIGDSIGTPDSLVPDLVPPGVKEFELHAKLGDISIVGFCDHFDMETKTLHENKTSSTKDRWTQKKVDEHPQLTMYCLMLFLQHKIKPEDITIYLNFIPVEEQGDFTLALPNPPKFTQFKTRRTTRQILEYAVYVQETVKKMDEYVLNRPIEN
jgi:hypothetical protein